MCRLVGWVGDRPRTLREVLGDDALARFVDLSCVHGHGWGLAHLDGTGRTRVRRSTLAAREDPDFMVAAGVASSVGLVHLRWATPGFGLDLANTHPFTAEGWAMIHNGAIGPADRVQSLRRRDSTRRPGGTTDSENLMLAVLDELSADELSGAAAGGPALATALETISDRAVLAGLSAASLNSMFLSPNAMHVLNWHDPAKVPGIDDDDPDSPPYYDLRHRHDDRPDGSIDIVASSGFVADPRSWTLLPNAGVLTIEFDGRRRQTPVRPAHPLCPVPLTDMEAGQPAVLRIGGVVDTVAGQIRPPTSIS